MMERKSKNRIRLVNLRAVSPGEGPSQQPPAGEDGSIVEIGLGYRVLISEQAEIWTILGYLKDGSPVREDIGEFSFVLLPGDTEPATAITGFLAPTAPYVMAMTDDAIREQLKSIASQLGYDRDGYYASIGIGGRFFYEENFRRE